MKAKQFLFGILVVGMSVLFTSCEADSTQEEIQELDQLEQLDLKAIDKEEITEEDT
ncbi:hypothetical protein [Aquimarina mytili]|uniref:Secreted protein n=1 Tax=Aquimarina mytili TaxID=874423 RepID=A0A936ZVA6_9FLAO|nr:hypothetical protein [Aquimarina mytili]MBL0686042.1 hypothetical protein [Aquimarina mytili]